MTTGVRRPRVALATSSDWAALAPDDRLIAPALARAGVDAEIAIWTDPVVAWDRYDLIVIRSCWNYHDDLPRWLGWLDALEAAGIGGERLCNPPVVQRWNSRKTYLSDLAARGVAGVPTAWLTEESLRSVETLVARLGETGWDELVCKPAVSAGALGTFRCRRSALTPLPELLVAALPELARRAPLLVQPFLPEIVAVGEWSLLFFDGQFSHAVLKRPAVGDFRVQEKHGGTSVTAVPSHPLHLAAERALVAAARATGTTTASCLYARVDLVETASGPLLVELELIEPALFLTAAPSSPLSPSSPSSPSGDGEQEGNSATERFAAAIARRVGR